MALLFAANLELGVANEECVLVQVIVILHSFILHSSFFILHFSFSNR